MNDSQMMDTDQLCAWLLEQASESVLQWLSEVWEGSRQIPAGFNWLGLAEISSNLAIKKDDLGWARVAILVNTSLIVEAKTHGHVFFSARVVPPEQRERVCFSFEERVMRLRVAFLLKRGFVPGDPVLDADRVVESFFDGLTLSPQEALKQFAGGKKTLSQEQVWKLDRIRRNLQFLQPLAERRLLPDHSELLTWYSLRDQLHFS
jgi:hypothetical protein